MNIKYKVGDKVKLRESSKFYHQTPDEIGEIVELTGTQNGDPEYTIFCFRIKFSSITNDYRPIDIELAEPTSLIGRYIKALVDRPDGGSVKKGEIGQIIREREVNFPSRKDYCISLSLETSLYELLPVDYYELLPIDDDDVPKSTYVAQPFPSDGEYIKLIVKHDINKKDVGIPGNMPNVIPKGTVTWCNKSYKSNILDNDIICIENNIYRANIDASCFEVHPDSKHLFEESKFQLPERWAVKCSAIPEDTPELFEWRTNENVDNSWSTDGYIDNSKTWRRYSSDEKIEITYNQFLTHVYNPWIKSFEVSDFSDMFKDNVEIPPIVVHCTTEKEFKHVVKHHNLSKYMSFTTYRGETGVSINGMYDYDGWTSIHNWKDWNKNSKILTYSEWVIKYNPVLDQPVLEPIKPCPKFKVGDRVIAIAESDGWGDVEKGDVGTVVKFYDKTDIYYVDFPNQSGWAGKEKCFQLAETIIKDDTFSVTNTELVTTSIVEKFTNPIRDIESVNVLITKKSKIKLLKI
jgi:hypothetical protein